MTSRCEIRVWAVLAIALGCLLMFHTDYRVVRAQEGTSAKKMRPTVRIEVYCNFGVRELLRKPESIPRLWKRFENSILQTFPDEPVGIDDLWAASTRRSRESERVIASHLGLLAGRDHLRDVRTADGYLVPALRSLADSIGEPRSTRVARGSREWLRNRLPIHSTRDEESGTTSTALLRTGGYRLLAADFRGGVYRPATRTLMLAGTELERDASESLTVFVALSGGPGAGTAGHWEEFTATLDLLALEHGEHQFDVWLWGKSSSGKSETVRVLWGPEVVRGMVQHETQFARLHHRGLRDVPFRDAVDPDDEKSAEQDPSEETPEGK